MSSNVCKSVNCHSKKIRELCKKVKEIEMNCCNGGGGGGTGTNLPDGRCFSDYLFWDGNEWKNGDFDRGKKIHIGCNSGETGQQSNAIAIGLNSGKEGQQLSSIAIGTSAGEGNQFNNSIAIGTNAGKNNQGTANNFPGNSIAIGNNAGVLNQKRGAIAIGVNSGQNNQGLNAISIGSFAGGETAHDNTIILNASGSSLNSESGKRFYVNPIRETNNIVSPNLNQLYYNPFTREILYLNS